MQSSQPTPAHNPTAEQPPATRDADTSQAVDAPKDAQREVAISDSRTRFSGVIWDVREDDFRLAEQNLTRQYIQHPGAVAVVAVDERHRMCLVRQYRHPVRADSWEIPAGLLDIAAEPLQQAAARELAEEAGLRAQSWEILVDHHPTSGSSTEGVRVFLARELTEIPASEREELHAEEAEMVLGWFPVVDVTQQIFAGNLHNANTIIGVLAYLTKYRATAESARILGSASFPVRDLAEEWLGRPGA